MYETGAACRIQQLIAIRAEAKASPAPLRIPIPPPADSTTDRVLTLLVRPEADGRVGMASAVSIRMSD